MRSDLLCWTFAGWEPDRHYRRLGAVPGTTLGPGRWIGAWRDRITSRDAVRFARDAGVDLMITHFYKGFGLDAEADERPRLKQFIDDCHAESINVWGYTQGGSLYYETLLAERPDAMDWAAREPDGSPQTCRGTYYRLMPCLTSPAYLDYMLDVARVGLDECDLDGIHMDNIYSTRCYCERCAGLFRDWLAKRNDLDERTGITTTAHIQPPPIKPDQQRFTDPLQILWLQFGLETRSAWLDAFNRQIKQCKPGAPFEINAGFPDSRAAIASRSVHPLRDAASCDYYCYEPMKMAEVRDDGTISTLAPAYLYGAAAGYGVINAAWAERDGTWQPPDTPGAVWAQLAESFSHHASTLGANWLLQFAGDGDRVYGDRDDLRAALTEATTFFRGLPVGKRRQWARVAVLIDIWSLTLAADTDHDATMQLLETLIARGVPFHILLDDQPIPTEVDTLIVWQQSCLSDAQLARIDAFTGRKILAGNVGQFDEWHLPRNKSDWGQRDLLDADLDALDLHGDLPTGVLMNTEMTDDGRLLIHLRDQAGRDDPVGPCALPQPYERATLHTPGAEPREVGGEPFSFTHYALLIVAA